MWNANLPKKTILRFAFALSLLAAAAVCCAVSFLLISNLERDVGEENYESIASTGLARAQELTLRRIEGLSTTATIMAFAFPSPEDWPMVSLNGYPAVSSQVAHLSGARAMGLMPFVRPDQVQEFEAHAKEIYAHNTYKKYPNNTGESEFGFGIWKRSKDSPHKDKKLHDTTGETPFPSKYPILAPILEHNWQKSPAIMFNIHSEVFRATGIDSALDCVNRALEAGATESPGCWVVSDWLELVPFPGEPAGQIYLPIFPANAPTTVVGMVGSTLLWDLDVLQDVFPENVNGLHCVIATETKNYTYIINGGIPERISEGDVHDPQFEEYARTITLTSFSTGAKSSADYTLTVYPTASMFDEYSTNTPLAVCLGFLGVIAFCATLFGLYDVLVRQESHQRKVILQMKRAFVRFISHEIRTPLNTVCLGLELLEDELADQKKKKNAAESHQEKDQATDNKETNTSITDSSSHSTFPMQDLEFWSDVTNDIYENAQSAVSVLNDLLNYDKIESHTLKIEVAQVDIWDLIKKTVKQFQIQAANKRIALDLTTTLGDSSSSTQDVEKSLGNLIVLGDDIRLTQVLRNVISNALKFTPSEGHIQVTAQYVPDGLPNAKPPLLVNSADDDKDSPHMLYPRSGCVVIRVKDSGEGLTHEQLDELFTEGVQFNVNKLQHGGGSGLGLAISKGIVEKHSGSITATSQGLGTGTTFIVELPLYGSTSEKANSEPTWSVTEGSTVFSSTTLSSPPLKQQEPRRRRVLVVEDTASSQKMLVRLLERAGHSCVTADNGKEAVDAVAADQEAFRVDPNHTPIDTILMDYEMPVMIGPEASSEIRKMGYHDTIFGVTGNVLSEDVEYFLANGADDVLGKPISMAALNQKWEKEKHWARLNVATEIQRRQHRQKDEYANDAQGIDC